MMDDSPSYIIDAPAPAPPRTPIWDWRDAGLFAGMAIPCVFLLYLIGMLAAKAFQIKLDSAPALVVFQSIAYAAIFFLLAAILRLTYDAPFWSSLGWLPSTVPSLVAIAFGISLAFAIGFLGGLLKVPEVDSPMKKLLSSPNGGLFLAIFGITVAPLAEELLFRGFLQPLMVRSLGAVAGIGLTSVLFGVLHLEQNGRVWQYGALISAAGLAFGVLRHLSGSTRTSVITHASYNGTLFFAFFFAAHKGQ
jgi:membrane protease YdiL (CAAX protease family)